MANTAWSIRVGVDLDTSDIQRQLNNATQGAKIDLDTSGAEGDLDNLNNKFDVTYQMANKIYQLSKEAISAMVEQVYTVDKALTEFKKVSDLRGSGLDEYVKELGESGQIVARTTSDMIDAATMFKKSGFTESEAKDLAVMATMFQNISDVSVTAGDAAASIVSQLQAFGRGNLEAIHILDAYNKVAADFAVGTNDLSSAMEIAAAGMATYGNSFEQTIGLITAGTEIMQGRSSQVARGLNTIAANIVKNKDLLAEYGIEVEDAKGNLKSTYDVLRELKPQWDKMTDAERNAVGITLAGKNQYRVLASIMTNFSHAVEATDDALNSNGTALQQNAAYMESLEARTTNLKALFQSFSQNVVDSDMVKGVLDLAAGFLQIANTDFGRIITQFTLLSGVLTGIAGMAIKGLGLSTPLVAVLPYIAAAVAAFVGLYNIIEAVQDELQKQADAKVFENVKNEIDESKTKINEYNDKIKESTARLEELNKVPFYERTDDINAEIARLEALIATYIRLKEEEENRISLEGLQKLRKTEFADKPEVFFDMNYINASIGSENAVTQEQINLINQLIPQYDTLEQAAWGLAKALNLNVTETTTVDDVISDLNAKGVSLIGTFHDWNEEITKSSYDMAVYASDLDGAVEPTERLLKRTDDLIKANKDKYDALKAVQSVNGNLSQQELDFIKNYELLITQYSKATLGAGNFAKAQKAISEAQEEWRNQRYDATLEDYVKSLMSIEGIDISNVGEMLDILKQTGDLSLDYTKEQLQQVLDKLSEVDGSTAEIQVDADTEEVFDEILSAEEQLEAQGITITSSSDADALLNSMHLIEEEITKLSSMPVKINVDSNMSKALTDANNVTKAVKNIPSNKYVSISISVYGLEAVQNAGNAISQIYSKTVTITINVLYRNAKTGQIMDGPPKYSTGTDYFSGGPALINDGTPINGNSAELVVANGKASIYNDGKPVVVNLPRGAKIYNASETQEILKNKKLLGNLTVDSFASGNVTKPSDINAENIVYDPSEYYDPSSPKPSMQKKNKESFEKWLKERKHLLELDLITEEQYYLDLEYMNENYLKEIKGEEEDYWRYQEEVYKWKKSQLVDENELLERQVELEKALQNVAKIKSQKILVYKDGKFQYMADIDAIAEAQRNVAELKAKGYASGTSNATSGLHLVGENGPELRVLNGGDGIIPADATKNLLQIAKMGTEGLSNVFNKTMQTIYNFAIDNLSLPNVSEPSAFLDGLKNYAYQYSYANA